MYIPNHLLFRPVRLSAPLSARINLACKLALHVPLQGIVFVLVSRIFHARRTFTWHQRWPSTYLDLDTVTPEWSRRVPVVSQTHLFSLCHTVYIVFYVCVNDHRAVLKARQLKLTLKCEYLPLIMAVVKFGQIKITFIQCFNISVQVVDALFLLITIYKIFSVLAFNYGVKNNRMGCTPHSHSYKSWNPQSWVSAIAQRKKKMYRLDISDTFDHYQVMFLKDYIVLLFYVSNL